ncbi:MAG: hypothetical protein ACERKV_03390 [Clostridiaceae bacterium]
MDENDELKQELEQELLWVKYRQRMLDIIDIKLFEMKELAQQAKQENCSNSEMKLLNEKIDKLKDQVNALDSESRKNEDGKILK